MDERAQVRIVLNVRIGKEAMIENLHAIADDAILQSGIGMQHTIFPDDRCPFERHIGIQYRVFSDRDCRVDPG